MEKNHQVWCSPYADLPAQFCKLQLRMSLSITVTLTYLTESQKQSNDSGICIRIYIYYTNGLFLQAQDITSITFHSEKQFWLNNDTPLIITLNFKDVEIWNKMSLVQSVKYAYQNSGTNIPMRLQRITHSSFQIGICLWLQQASLTTRFHVILKSRPYFLLYHSLKGSEYNTLLPLNC